MARPGRWSAEQAAEQMRLLGGAPSYMEFLRWTRGRRVEGLRDITSPVLVAWGSRDLLLPSRQAARFARELPHAELRLLPGVGHVPMADDPQLIASIILEFTGIPINGHRRSSTPT
jgi:pimeloyl-ACP methyl ester carboxylesterase